MKRNLNDHIRRIKAEREKRRRRTAFLTALSFIVTGNVAWQLRSIGTAMTSPQNVSVTTTCGSDTTDSTVRSDECYEVIFDTGDGVLPDIPEDISGTRRERMVSIAASQKGYICKSGISGYSAWYGSGGEEWNTAFVCWCMNRAGIDDVPLSAGCWGWSVRLENEGMLSMPHDHSPVPGDVVFIDSDDDGKPDRCAVITSLTDDGGYTAVEGDHEGSVAEVMFLPGDSRVCGFLALEEPEETSEPETEPAEAETFSFSFMGETESGIMVSAEAEAEAFPADTEMFVTDISVDDALAAAQEHFGEDAELYDAVAVDISFRTPEGDELEPEGMVQVTMTLPEELNLSGEEMSLIHLSDDGVTETVDDADITAGALSSQQTVSQSTL